MKMFAPNRIYAGIALCLPVTNATYLIAPYDMPVLIRHRNMVMGIPPAGLSIRFGKTGDPLPVLKRALRTCGRPAP